MLPTARLLYICYQDIQVILACHQLSGIFPRALQELTSGENRSGCGFGGVTFQLDSGLSDGEVHLLSGRRAGCTGLSNAKAGREYGC